MLLKTSGGQDFNAASNGKANLGVALGAVGTGLGLLGGNGNGILNLGGNGNCEECCDVHQREFFGYQLDAQKNMYENLMSVSDRICAVENRVSTDEANISKNFEIEQIRATYENALMKNYVDATVANATCGMVRGQTYLSPSQLADPFHSRNNYIETYSLGRRDNCGCGGGFGMGYDAGCGC